MNWFCFALIWACIVIGLPAWLVGCNSYLSHTCVAHELINATLVQKSIFSGVCCSPCETCAWQEHTHVRACESTCCGKHECWSCSYHFQGQDIRYFESCSSVYPTMEEAMRDESVYVMDHMYSLAYNSKAQSCASLEGSWWTWLMGSILLSLAGLLFCTLVGIHIYLTFVQRPLATSVSLLQEKE